jgi:hypothetical protein
LGKFSWSASSASPGNVKGLANGCIPIGGSGNVYLKLKKRNKKKRTKMSCDSIWW